MPAYFYFLLPVRLGLSMADCAVDKPAEMAELEFPRRAIFAGFQGAVPHLPAGLALCIIFLLQSQKKQKLALDVGRDFPPSLFKALNCFGGDTQ